MESGNGSNESCANSSFSGEQSDQILITSSSTGMVSMVSCLTAVLMVVLLRLYKKFVYRLALYQVLASLFFSFTISLELMALHYDSKSGYSRRACTAVGFLTQYSSWVKLMFMAFLTFHLFCLVVLFKNFQKLEVFYILASVLSPLLHAWIPFIKQSYGMSHAWCGIRVWNNDCAKEKYTMGLIERFALWYVPFVVIALINALAIVVMVIVLVQRAFFEKRSAKAGIENEPLLARKKDQRKEVVRQLMPLLAYPLLFLVIIVFVSVTRVYGALVNTTSFPLEMIHAVLGLSYAYFAGLALILHICLMRECSFKKRKSRSRNVHPDSPCVNGNVCEVNIEPITAKTTRHAVPAESEVDALKLCKDSLVDVEPTTATTTQHFVPAESEVDGLKLGWNHHQCS